MNVKRSESLPTPSALPPQDPQHELEDLGSSNHHSIPLWWPLVPQIFGMAVIAYEVLFDSLDRPYVIAAGLTLAIGGKFADSIRRIL